MTETCWCRTKLHLIRHGGRDFPECPHHGSAYKQNAEVLARRNEYLADFDRLAHPAFVRLREILSANEPVLTALARARLTTGFDTYPDGPMFSWGVNRLKQETLEELSDGGVYVQRILVVERDQPSACSGANCPKGSPSDIPDLEP